jgi:phospho-N-acetylmuramoyl-pentapeptide-transferase
MGAPQQFSDQGVYGVTTAGILVTNITITFALVAAFMPAYIKRLQILSWGQQIRPEGPADHMSKKGTPTMGGLLVLCAFLCSLLWVRPITVNYLVLLAVVVINGMAGFFDDFLKIKKTRSLGLRARDKLLIQLIVGIAVAFYMIRFSPLKSTILLPFLNSHADLGIFFYPFCVLVMAGFVNAVNLTDGLDGLAAGSVIITLAGSGFIFFTLGRVDMMVGCAVLAGALMGFLVFNCFPARVFMGDTGSLALGGALATLSILTGTELFMALMGGVYVVEAFSVMLQVSYFKLTKGKRIFKMSPIHHHFALMGWHEVQVTTRFWVVGLFLALIGILIYRG